MLKEIEEFGGPVLRAMRDTAWVNKGAYFNPTRRAGARAYDMYNHMWMPGLYTHPEDEYRHLLEHVTIWDVAVERQVEIDGPDGAAFMESLTPRDVSKCAVGECKYVLLTTPQGGIINDPVLLRLSKDRFWLSLSDWDVLFWCLGVAVHSGLDVVVREPDVSPVQIQGPKSKDLMKDLFGSKVLDMEYYTLLQTKLDGIPVVITRTGWSAEVGYEIYLEDQTKGEDLWDRVIAAGKPHNIRAIAPSEIRRIEAGILNYSSDIVLENNPYEVGLGWTVDLDKKADFLGRDALRKIKAEGPKRKLVGIEVDGAKVGAWISHYWPVHAGEKRIGHVTSLTHSPRLKKNIGFALVPIEYGKLGTKFKVTSPWGDRNATVVKKPFVDPTKEIPKS